MNDVEESAARSVQDETKTMCRSLLQRSPADHAEAFEPSLTMPSMPRTMFCSAALHSGEPDPLQSIKQSINQSINQSWTSKAMLVLPTSPGRRTRARCSLVPISTSQVLEHALDYSACIDTSSEKDYAGPCNSRTTSRLIICRQGPAKNVNRCEGDVHTTSNRQLILLLPNSMPTAGTYLHKQVANTDSLHIIATIFKQGNHTASPSMFKTS
jgi:hypothetical protein